MYVGERVWVFEDRIVFLGFCLAKGGQGRKQREVFQVGRSVIYQDMCVNWHRI